MSKKPNYENLIKHTLNGLKEEDNGSSLSENFKIDVNELPEGFEKYKANNQNLNFCTEEHAKKNTKKCSRYEYVTASISQIERETGFSRSKINNTIKELEQKGELKKITRKNEDGGNATNLYIVNSNN